MQLEAMGVVLSECQAWRFVHQMIPKNNLLPSYSLRMRDQAAGPL